MEQRDDMMCVKVYSSIVEAIERVESMHDKLQQELEHRERVKQAFYSIQVKDIQLFLRTLTTIDINARDQIFQQTLLHCACSEGFNKVSQILLSKGADVNTVDLNYWTPLHTACNTGNLELINILLDHNASTSTKSRDGNIPLHYFTRCSSVSVTGHNLYVDVLLRLLRDNPSSVNEKNNQGETPLHEAAFRGSKLTIRYIIKYSSAKINITNNNGESPLHYAIRSGNKQVVQFMLEMGSDPSINSEYSGTPLQLAIKENRQDFVQLIHKSISQNRVPRKPGTENDDFEGRIRDEYGFIVDRELEEMNEQAEYKRFKNVEEVKKNWKKYIISNNMLEEIKNKSPQLQKLLNKGIPHELRGEIWFKLAQIRMQSPVTEKEYKYLLSGEEFPFAEEIEKDILRTFPGHNFFTSEGGKSSVRNILLAYSIRNPKVGYCQSMNFIVGLLLLCMPEDRAFNVLCYIVEDLLVGYFGTDMQGLSVDQRIIDFIIEKRMPKVFEAFNYFSIPSSIITTKWMMCIFLNSTPTETTMRIWDCFLLMGAESLILVCMSFIKMCEPYVESADTSQKFVHLLNNSTRTMYDADQLLKTAMKCKLTLFEGCELSSLRIDFKAQIEAEREEMDKRRKKLENMQRERNNNV